MEYRVELTQEAYKSCRAKPTARLLEAILSMKPGDRLVVEGEEFTVPSRQVVGVVEESGLRVEEYETDGILYRVVASKPG